MKNWKATKPRKVPLTGTEVVHIFANKRDLGELELYYLKEVNGDSYRYSYKVMYHALISDSHECLCSNFVLLGCTQLNCEYTVVRPPFF